MIREGFELYVPLMHSYMATAAFKDIEQISTKNGKTCLYIALF